MKYDRTFYKFFNSDLFDKYPDKINKINYERVGQLSSLVATASVLGVIGFLVVGNVEGALEATMHIVFMSAIAIAFHRRGADNPWKKSNLVFYIMLTPILLSTAIIDAYVDPDEQGFTSFMLLSAVPCLVLDKPKRLFSYTLGIAIVQNMFFLIFVSDRYIHFQVVSHTIVAFVVSIIVSSYVLRIRMDNIQKTVDLEHISEHDALTGAYNRIGGEKRIESQLESGQSGVFTIIDIDSFKAINDNYGHAVGDKVLMTLSDILIQIIGDAGTVTRIGGDEFITYKTGRIDEAVIAESFSKAKSQLQELILDPDSDQHVTISIGIIICDISGGRYRTLYRLADELLYNSKRNGKNTYSVCRLSDMQS